MQQKITTVASTLFILITMLIVVNPIMAQQKGQQRRQQGPPPIPNVEQIEKMVADLSQELSLSNKQEKKVSELYFAHFDEVEKMREKNKNSRGTSREEMDKCRKEFDAEVKAELSIEQQEKYDTYLKERRSQYKGQNR